VVKVMQVQMARVCRRESANWDHRQLKVADWRNPFTNGVDTGKQARKLGLFYMYSASGTQYRHKAHALAALPYVTGVLLER